MRGHAALAVPAGDIPRPATVDHRRCEMPEHNFIKAWPLYSHPASRTPGGPLLYLEEKTNHATTAGL